MRREANETIRAAIKFGKENGNFEKKVEVGWEFGVE